MTPLAKWYARQRAGAAIRQAERHAKSSQTDLALAAYDRAAGLDRDLRKLALKSAAALLVDEHRLAEAASRLQALVILDKTDIESWRVLARTLRSSGDSKAAIKAWRRVCEIEPTDLEAHRMLLELLPEGCAESIAPLRVLSEAAGENLVLRRRLAEVLERNGHLDEALGTWKGVLGASPDDAVGHENVAALLHRMDRLSEAVPHLKEIVRARPAEVQARLLLATALDALGDGPEAFRAWTGLIEIDPSHARAHRRLADLLLDQGLKASAGPHLRAVAEADADGEAWRRVAQVQAELGQREEAVAAWRRVLALAPGDRGAHEALAELLEDDPAEALPHLKALAAATPKALGVWRAMGRVCAGLGDRPAAIQAFRRVLRFEPQDLEAHGALAELLAEKAAALPHLEVLADHGPDRAEAGRRLAELLIRTGDKAAAKIVLERLVSEDGGDLDLRKSLAQVLQDLGLNGEAAVHLHVIAEASSADVEPWWRLARALRAAEDAGGEAQAWRRVLAIDEEDLAAHERMGALLSQAGRHADAAAHLRKVVRIAPENPKAWRRYVRARQQSGASADTAALWTETLALAGQSELAAQIEHSQELQGRVERLKRDLQLAGAELKRGRGEAQHALGRLEQEERSHRVAQALLKEESAERRRLTAELQESVQRRRQAEAEEARHLLVGRLLGMLEPLAGAEPITPCQDDAAAYVDEALRAAASKGAVIVSREADARLMGVDVVQPEAVGPRLGGRGGKVVVLTDSDAAMRADVRGELAGRRGLTILDAPELLVRRAAGVDDLKFHIAQVSEDTWPTRAVMVASADERLRDQLVQAVSKTTDIGFAPLFPSELKPWVESQRLDLDGWLAAAWSARGRPRVFGFQFDPESLALFVRQIRSGRAQVMAKVFRRAAALQLVWSDKALQAAAHHFAQTGEAGVEFDAGDAQIEVKSYRRLLARDMMLESAFEQLGKFKPATVKAYRELFDKSALGRFCRDAGLALSISGFAELDERTFGFSPSEALIRGGRLIADAVASLTAVREPEAPPQGLVQYGLGRSLEALGRHADALEAYQEAVVRAPTYFPARVAAARYLELAGRPQEAERLLRKGLGNGTPDPDVQEGLLDFYQRNASPLGVAAVSRLMLKRGQSRPAIAAPALISLGRWREAEPLLKALAPRIAGQDTFLNDLVGLPEFAGRLQVIRSEAEGGDAGAQLRLAEALRRLGDLEGALPWYGRALAKTGVLEAELGVGEAFRPQFLMVGPPRTGTTLLRRLFELHPQIAAPSGELFFFSNRTGERAGSNRQRAPLSWYLSAFSKAAERKPDAKLIGEKTPHYFSTSDEQMVFASLLLPNVKIIATLRDPVVRAWSEIKVQRRVTEAEIVATLSNGPYPNWLAEILDAGRYVAHLKRWLKHIRPEQLLLVDSDALETQVVEEAGRIFRWLGVRELGRRQVADLQGSWNNRTEGMAASVELQELLNRFYAGNAWRLAEVGAAIHARSGSLNGR